MADCFDYFLNLPTTVPKESPLDYEWIREQQQADEALLTKYRKNPQRFFYKTFYDDFRLLCYHKPVLNKEKQWKFAMTASMIKPTIRWFHAILGHPGSKRLQLALQLQFYHEDLSTTETSLSVKHVSITS